MTDSNEMDVGSGENYLKKVSAFHEYMMAKPEFRAEYESWCQDLDKKDIDNLPDR